MEVYGGNSIISGRYPDLTQEEKMRKRKRRSEEAVVMKDCVSCSSEIPLGSYFGCVHLMVKTRKVKADVSNVRYKCGFNKAKEPFQLIVS